MQELWWEMLLAWQGLVKDPEAYFERQRAEAMATSMARDDDDSGSCAYILVVLARKWPFAFARKLCRRRCKVLKLNCDVWVGVTNCSDKTCRYDLYLHRFQRTFYLRPGESQLLLGTNAAPALCLWRQGCEIEASEPPFYLVSAIVNNVDRLALGREQWAIDGLAVADGRFGGLADESHTVLPCLEEAWRGAASRTHECVSQMKEELMQVACHPSRLEQIGVD